MIFAAGLTLSYSLGYITFILKDPRYYDLSSGEVSEFMGFIGLIYSFLYFVEYLFLGFLVDIIGRKIPILVSVFLITAGVFTVPAFREVYPFLAIFRVLSSLGNQVLLH